MKSLPQENPWMRRTKWLTQALIVSGTLNIGLVATFITFAIRDKHQSLSVPSAKEQSPSQALSNSQVLHSYSLLSYQELLLRLENKDLVEEGLCMRDLALGCLVTFHHFNLDKALGGLFLQKRVIPFKNTDGAETIEVSVFPGLADYQFQAIAHYSKTEKWPLTAQGLFFEIKRSPQPIDPTLLDAFYLTSEYHTLHTLLSKTGIELTREQTIALLSQTEWQTLSQIAQRQRANPDFSPDARRYFLLEALSSHSTHAAQLLLETDLEFILKRLDDRHILTLLDLATEPTAALVNFGKGLLSSPRTDAVWQRAACLLYTLANETQPIPFDHHAAIHRFIAPMPKIEVVPPPAPPKIIHTVEPGENLWKIARKYQVSIDAIMKLNHLETEKLRPGKKLQMPIKE